MKPIEGYSPNGHGEEEENLPKDANAEDFRSAPPEPMQDTGKTLDSLDAETQKLINRLTSDKPQPVQAPADYEMPLPDKIEKALDNLGGGNNNLPEPPKVIGPSNEEIEKALDALGRVKANPSDTAEGDGNLPNPDETPPAQA